MSYSVLQITDGTKVNTIDLLSPRFGYILCNWRPARPPLDHTMSRNTFTGLSTPALVTRGETIETMTFNARHNNVDDLILDEQRLGRILYWASLYWTGDRGVERPFYIKAKAKKETNMRYATIFSAQLHDDSNPYAAPFFQRQPASTDLVVPISRGDWLDHVPGEDGIEMFENVGSQLLSNLTNRNQGTWFLNEDARVFLTNSLSHAGVTHIYSGNDTQNLLELPEDLGYPLFETNASGTYTYFGMRINPSNPWLNRRGFPGIWFNITTPTVMGGFETPVFTWEIHLETSPGVFGWVPVSIEDGTEGFTIPGTILFNDTKNLWSPVTFNNVNGWWVRVVRNTGIMTQGPEVSVRHPAATVLPHFDVLLATEGDENALNTQGEVQIFDVKSQSLNPLVPQIDLTIGEYVVDPASNYWMTYSAANSTGLESIFSWQIRSNFLPYTVVEGEEVYVQMQEGTIECYMTMYDFYAPSFGQEVSMRGFWYYQFETAQCWVDFTISDAYADIGQSITFDPTKSFINYPAETISEVEWRFGDGAEQIVAGPTLSAVGHTYTEAGAYTIYMKITFTGGRVAWVWKGEGVMVVVDAVVPSFTSAHRRGFAPFNPEFDASASTAASGTITSYFWQFGDGTTGTGVKPNKTYTAQGVYTVTLRVDDDQGNWETITQTNYIYVDNQLLYPGDFGIYMKLGFDPVVPSWFDETPNRLYIGARPIVGTEDPYFQGFIPVYGDQYSQSPGWTQPTAIQWSNTTGWTLEENSTAYTGYAIQHLYEGSSVPLNPGDEVLFASVGIQNRAYRRYRGTYRVFLRVGASVNIARGDIYWSVGVSPENIPGVNTSSGLNRTRRVTDAIHTAYNTLIDLGSVTLGGKEAVIQYLDIFWQPFMAKASQKIWLYDVVLIPQDKWFVELSFPFYNFDYGQSYEVSVSSLTPNSELEAKILKKPQEWLEKVPSSIPDLPLYFVGKDIRFTVLSARYDPREPIFDPSVPALYSNFEYFLEVSSVMKVNRYFSHRGKR
jgi:PKD repeat protein